MILSTINNLSNHTINSISMVWNSLNLLVIKICEAQKIAYQNTVILIC